MPATTQTRIAYHGVAGQKTTARLVQPAEGKAPFPLLIWIVPREKGAMSQGESVAELVARRGYATAILSLPAAGTEPSDLAPLAALRDEAQADVAGAITPDMLAQVEDVAGFLAWHATEGATAGLGDHLLIGGTGNGGTAALNTLYLGETLGHAIPAFATAIVANANCPLPARAQGCPTLVLALHDPTRADPRPMRELCTRLGARALLFESDTLDLERLRLHADEPSRAALRRILRADRRLSLGRSITRAGETRPIPRDPRIVLVTCMRNEGPFILEWIAHNRAIGVTDFIVFSNDCTDGTDDLLDRLDAMGVIHHLRNPSTALGTSQHLRVALSNAAHHAAFRFADYMIVSDVDEFIQIDAGDRTLPGLLDQCGWADVVSMNELMFGLGGVERFEDRPVTEQFRVSATTEPAKDRARRGVKSLVRIHDGVLRYSNHRPRLEPGFEPQVHWVDGSGAPMPHDFIAGKDRGIEAAGRYGYARVNHYTLRSAESLLVKFDRGDAVRGARMRPDYVEARNGHDVLNDSFAPHLPGLRAELDALMRDAELARLHATCVARHREMIATLRADPATEDLWNVVGRALKARPDTADSKAA